MSTATLEREDALKGEIIEAGGSGTALMALNRSEIDVQISTAKRYPRSLKEFVREASEMVSLSRDIAIECMYSLKRRGDDGAKVIEGPSARMAEIVASAWGNCRAGARVIDEDDRFVTAQGVFSDLQRNVAITYEVRRRITNKFGKKYSDDMVGVTANAACSIALRNAVFKGVPKAFWWQIYQKAREVAIGNDKTLAQRRADMLAAFSKMGVEKEKVFAYLEVPGLEDVTLDHLGLMIGVFNAIRDGETSIDETFNAQEPKAGSRVGTSSLTDKLANGKAKKSDEAAQPGPTNEQQADQREPLDKLKSICADAYDKGDIAAFARLNDEWCGPEARWTDDPELFAEAGKIIAEWREKLTNSPSTPRKRSQKQAFDSTASATEAGH